jgi:hypothetical protein
MHPVRVKTGKDVHSKATALSWRKFWADFIQKFMKQVYKPYEGPFVCPSEPHSRRKQQMSRNIQRWCFFTPSSCWNKAGVPKACLGPGGKKQVFTPPPPPRSKSGPARWKVRKQNRASTARWPLVASAVNTTGTCDTTEKDKNVIVKPRYFVLASHPQPAALFGTAQPYCR